MSDHADWNVTIAASSASLISTVIGYPIDSVKTRMQTYSYPSIAACVRHTYRVEGSAGFYRGLVIPLATVTMARTTSFSIYEWSRAALQSTCDWSPTSYQSTFLSGMLAGVSVSVLAAPFELTKLASQLDQLMYQRPSGSPQMSTWETARSIYRRMGPRGFYSGYTYHACRDSLGTGLFFTTYNKMKSLLSGGQATAPPWVHAVSGGTCGIVAWTLVYPIDTLKAVTQRDLLSGKPSRTTSIVWRTLYRGVHVSLLRSAIINAINFTV